MTPIPFISTNQQKRIIALVDEILKLKKQSVKQLKIYREDDLGLNHFAFMRI